MGIIPNSPFLPGLIKAAGHLGGYFLSKMEVRNQNKYNEPINQAKRLREAGLPMAAAESFNNRQDSLPDVSGVGRAGDKLGDYYKVDKAITEAEIAEELLNYWHAQAGIKINEGRFSDADVKFLLDEGYIKEGDAKSWYRHAQEIDMAMKGVAQSIQGHQNEILRLEEDLRTATNPTDIKIAEAKLNQMLLNIQMGNEELSNMIDFSKARQKIVQSMSQGGLSFGEAMLIQILQGVTGGVSNKGVNVGF